MKIVIPENLKGKELFKFLIANKDLLISQKKAFKKKADPVLYIPSIISPAGIKTETTKALPGDQTLVIDPSGQLRVKVVANTAWYCDHAMDVLTDKCYDQSVKEKGTLIPHIKNHLWEAESHVGDVEAVYTQLLTYKELGYPGAGKTTCLIFETLIREDYDEKIYKFYKNGKITQHSIGLLYLSIGLCINDKDYLPEFELWNKYYDKVINKDLIDERGYFWIVPEIKVLENSCVLFGCNELTGTLETEEVVAEKDDTLITPEIPGDKTPLKKSFFDIPIPKTNLMPNGI